MATKVVKTIGDGGDYADWDAFVAAAPTDLVALDQQWDVVFKNQAHTRSSSFAFTTARTTSETCYFHFTAESGGAWCDAANVRSKPFTADETFGARLVNTGSGSVLNINVSHTKVDRLQLLGRLNASGAQPSLYFQSTATNCDGNQLIIDGYGQNSSVSGVARLAGATNYLRNSLVIQRATVATAITINIGTGAKLINVTAVALNAKLNVGMTTGSSTAAVLRNVALFNFTAPESGTTAASKENCYTDASAAGWTTVPYSTGTFESITPASPDFRLKADSPLINAGAADATYAANDATGLARPVGSAYDVGAWEYYVPAAPDTTGPILEGAAAAATGSSTAAGTVGTDEAGGLLYALASTNASGVTAPTIKASGQSQTVSNTGMQDVAFASLTPATTYYPWYYQEDAAGNPSNVVVGAAFTTAAVDNVAPEWPNGAEITPGTVTASSVAFSYPAATDNSGSVTYDISKDGGTTWENNGSGLSAEFIGLPSSTVIPLRVRPRDPAGNIGAALSASMTTAAAPTGSFKSSQLSNGAQSAWPAGTLVMWEWHQGGRIGSAPTSITRGAGALASDRTLSTTGCPTGAGILLVAKRNTSAATDDVYYEAGTVS